MRIRHFFWFLIIISRISSVSFRLWPHAPSLLPTLGNPVLSELSLKMTVGTLLTIYYKISINYKWIAGWQTKYSASKPWPVVRWQPRKQKEFFCTWEVSFLFKYETIVLKYVSFNVDCIFLTTGSNRLPLQTKNVSKFYKLFV